jgi:SAM-dependent methyltransferase
VRDFSLLNSVESFVYILPLNFANVFTLSLTKWQQNGAKHPLDDRKQGHRSIVPAILDVGPQKFFRANRAVAQTGSLVIMHSNYREAHVGKGRDYHEKFVRGPYRSVIWQLEQVQLLAILARYKIRQRSPIRLLDFACGTGRILQLFESQVDSAVGVDVSKTMLEVAAGHLSQVELLHVDITCEPALADRRFEVITAFRFFPNAEPELRDDVMRKLVSLLAEGGILILNNHLRCSGTKMQLRRAIYRLRGKGKERDLHCMSDEEVVQLADRFGLSIREVHALAVIPVLKEKRPLFPRWLLLSIERWAADRASLSRVANNRIYVLGHAMHGRLSDDQIQYAR